jgi:hypothetical protein
MEAGNEGLISILGRHSACVYSTSEDRRGGEGEGEGEAEGGRQREGGTTQEA